MQQLTRKLSQQATFTASPSLLAVDEQEILIKNLEQPQNAMIETLVIGILAWFIFFHQNNDIADGLNYFLCSYFLSFTFRGFCLHYFNNFTLGEVAIILQSATIFLSNTFKDLTTLSRETPMDGLMGLALRIIIADFTVLTSITLNPSLKFIRKLPHLFDVLFWVLVLLTAMIPLQMVNWNMLLASFQPMSCFVVLIFCSLIFQLDFIKRYVICLYLRMYVNDDLDRLTRTHL